MSAQGQTGPTTQDEAETLGLGLRLWLLDWSSSVEDGERIWASLDSDLLPKRIYLRKAQSLLAAGYLPPAEVERQITAARTQALRDAADDFQINTWADVVTPALKTRGIPALAVTQAFIDWLRDRASRTATPEETK